VLLGALAGIVACSTNGQTPSRPRPTPKPIVNFSCGALAIGMEPRVAVAGLTGGLIVPGRGVAKIDLGMTRDQVIAAAGSPVCEVDDGLWDFAPVSPDEPHTASRLIVLFDRGADGNPKAKVERIVAAGSGFQLEDGSPAFGPGSYDRFIQLYAGRITASGPDAIGDWTYRVSPAPGASGAVTEFTGRAPGPNALDLGTVAISPA
jgi:hypothetical protein